MDMLPGVQEPEPMPMMADASRAVRQGPMPMLRVLSDEEVNVDARTRTRLGAKALVELVKQTRRRLGGDHSSEES